MSIVIDPELQAFIPPLTPAERDALEAEIVRDGRAMDPIVVWSTPAGDVVVDGHHRYEICTRRDLPFALRYVTFASRGEAKAWMLSHQLARRNLTADQVCAVAALRGCDPPAAFASHPANLLVRELAAADPDALAKVVQGKQTARVAWLRWRDRTGQARSRTRVVRDTEPAPAPAPDDAVGRFSDLVRLVRRRPMSRSELARALRLADADVTRLVADAQFEGASIAVTNGIVSYVTPPSGDDPVPILSLANEGAIVRVGVISDTHFGSKFCMRHQLADCVRWMRDEGVTTVLHAGDWTQGIFDRHSAHEVTATSQHDQLAEMAEWLPRHEGLHYHGIAGNHDETWCDRTGFPFATAQAAVWREVGRDDVTIHGSTSAFLSVSGVVVNLWHGGSVAYAASYHLQGKAESYAAIKPSILLAGHVHRFCYVEQRGIECILVPCFQGGEGPFAKRLKGSPSIGGLILSWRMSTGGSFRDFAIARRRYYERERVHVAENPVHGEVVDPVVAAPAVKP